MLVTLDGWMHVEKKGVPEHVLQMWREVLTMANPDVKKAKMLGVKMKGPAVELLYEEDEEVIRLPRGYGLMVALPMLRDFVAEGLVVIDSRFREEKMMLLPEMQLFAPRFDQQEAAVSGVVQMLNAEPFGGVLVAGCGAGKTVIGVEVSRRMAVRTAVIVHKEFLADQWEAEIRERRPKAQIGRVQGDRCDLGCDVTICMIQSLVGERKYPQRFFESIGLVIGDEGHRLGAMLWREAIVKFPARYRLLLSATPTRKDGRHEVFEQHVGRRFWKMERAGLKPRVEKLTLPTMIASSRYTNAWNRKVNLSRLISILAGDHARTTKFVSIVEMAARADRQVLVLSDRLAQLETMQEMLTEARLPPGARAAMYVGGMKKADREAAEDAEVLLATYAMAEEGLDIPTLSVVVLATPRSKVEQSVGRILREVEGKAEPVVVDGVDVNVPICKALAGARGKTYRKLGYV